MLIIKHRRFIMNPRIAPYADRFVVGLDLKKTPFYEMTIDELSKQHIFYGYSMLNGFNRLAEAAEEGPFKYPLYTQEEIEADPKKGDVCFMYFPSMDPDADTRPFLISVPGDIMSLSLITGSAVRNCIRHHWTIWHSYFVISRSIRKSCI